MVKAATVTQIKPGDTDAAKNTTTAGRKRAPENETPRDRFKRIAGGRLDNAVSAIRLLGQVNGSAYEFSAADVDKIKATLEAECGKMLAALRGEKKAKEVAALFD